MQTGLDVLVEQMSQGHTFSTDNPNATQAEAVVEQRPPVEVPVAQAIPEVALAPEAVEAPKLSQDEEDYINSLSAPVEVKTENAPVAETKENVKYELPKEISEDPFIQDYLELKKKGGDTRKWIKDSFNDFTDAKGEDVMKAHLHALNFSEEDIATELEAIFGESSTMTKLQRTELINETRDKLNAGQSEKNKKYISSIPDNSAEIAKEQARLSTIQTNAIRDLDTTYKEKFVGKRIGGLPITEDIYNKVSQFVKEQGRIFHNTENGRITGIDLDETVRYATWKLYESDMSKANLALGEVKGYNKLYAQRTRPSTENTSTASVVEQKDINKVLSNMPQERQELINKFAKH